MKKLILGMMLVMVLSFSNDKGVDRHDFDELKLRAEATYIKKELKQKRKTILSNVFRDENSLFNDRNLDRNDFDELKLRAEASCPREGLKRKRRLNNLFW